MGALFALNVALNIPLFERGETPYRDSIEGGYASMARFFSQHPNPWGWNPTQYCGLPAQFTYLPGLPYLAAAVTTIAPSLEPDYAYRLVASTFACLGPATLFLFVLYFTRSRWWALAVAVVYTFLSPTYYVAHTIDADRGQAYLPWRLQVLVKYGEGPHNAGLTMMPLALIALWEAALTPGFRRIFLAALLLAAVTLTNWVAALALAFCCLALLIALAGSQEATNFRAARVFAAAAVAYGLACFWLTPSFIRVIAFNWPVDAFNYHLLRPQALLLGALPLGIALLRFLMARFFPGRYYLWFVTMSLFGFAWVALWFYSRGINTVPESRRYALEMEMFLVVAAFEWFRLVMRIPAVPRRFGIYTALAILLSGWGQFRQYCTQGFRGRHPAPARSTIEYRLAERLATLRPQGRVFASGGLRFRLNSWFDIPQVGGGFESGLLNRMPLTLGYQIRTGMSSAAGHEGQDAVRELQTLGAEYVVVHGPKSREHYRDFKNPHKFDGLLDVAWREEDDTIYRVPFSSLAHLVSPNELSIWRPPEMLSPTDPYPAAIADPSRPKLTTSWHGASEFDVHGPILQGQLVSVQVNYDPGWRARQDGRPVAVERDRLGFLVLRADAAPLSRINLKYRGSLEQRVMAALSAIVWIGSLVRLAQHK